MQISLQLQNSEQIALIDVFEGKLYGRKWFAKPHPKWSWLTVAVDSAGNRLDELVIKSWMGNRHPHKNQQILFADGNGLNCQRENLILYFADAVFPESPFRAFSVQDRSFFISEEDADLLAMPWSWPIEKMNSGELFCGEKVLSRLIFERMSGKKVFNVPRHDGYGSNHCRSNLRESLRGRGSKGGPKRILPEPSPIPDDALSFEVSGEMYYLDQVDSKWVNYDWIRLPSGQLETWSQARMKKLRLHREIMGAKEKQKVLFIDGNPHNLCRSNLLLK